MKISYSVAVLCLSALTLSLNTLALNLSGSISANQTLPSGDHHLTANATVDSGVTLTLEAGARLIADGNYTLNIKGHLATTGSSTSSVVFTSGQASPAKGNWGGIRIHPTGSATLTYTTIEYASSGIYFDSASGTLTNSIFQHNHNGLYINADSNPQVTGSEISDNTYGVYIRGVGSSSGAPEPVLTNNTVTNNGYGFYLYGTYNQKIKDPQPIINGNTITNNDSRNFHSTYFADGANATINATGNWWGSTDVNTIASKIHDHSDNNSDRVPFVDFSGFLDSENGNVVSGTMLFGVLSGQTLSSDNYTVIGDVIVPAGTTLTISAGSQFFMPIKSDWLISGTLISTGTSAQPIMFTSGQASPTKGNWAGIKVKSGGSASLTYTAVQYATYGVRFDNASGTIANSTFQHNTNGLYINADSDPQITGSTLSNNTYGVNIRGVGSSSGAPEPILTSNTISNNSYGIYVYGTYNQAARDPRPVINGNTITNNSNRNLYTFYFADAVNTTINARGNWWGSTDINTIASKITDHSDSNNTLFPFVDFGGFLDSENGDAIVGTMLFGVLSDQTLPPDNYTLIGDVIVPAGTTLTISPGSQFSMPMKSDWLVGHLLKKNNN